MPRMDETNLHILQLLQKDARMTVTQIAQAVGRSESTVRERVAALEMGGFLKGYEARVDWQQAGLPMLAVVLASCDMNRLAEVAKQLAAIPNVTRALLLTGPKPVFVMLRVRDMAQLHAIVRDHLAGDLQNVEIQVSLESLVDRRPPAMPEAPPNVTAPPRA